MNIIFNEKKFIENFMKENNPNLVGYGNGKIGTKSLIGLLTKYYYDENDQQKTFDTVDSYMHTLLNDYKDYSKYINQSYENCKRGYGLKVITEFKLYKSEYDCIQKCESDKEKKLLFTLYMIAKYCGNTKGKVYGGIIRSTLLFKLADINLSYRERYKLIYNMFKRKQVKLATINTDNGVWVELGDQNEPVIMTITRFNHFGNQFIAHEKKGYKVCEKCGRLVKVKNIHDYSTKYCGKCAKEIKIIQTIESNRRQK